GRSASAFGSPSNAIAFRSKLRGRACAAPFFSFPRSSREDAMASRAVAAVALVAALWATLAAQPTTDLQARREASQHYRSGQEFMAAEQFDRAVEEFSKAIQNDKL